MHALMTFKALETSQVKDEVRNNNEALLRIAYPMKSPIHLLTIPEFHLL